MWYTAAGRRVRTPCVPRRYRLHIHTLRSQCAVAGSAKRDF